MGFIPYLSLKIKILAVVLFIQMISLGVFFHFAYHIFQEDKRAFVSELNDSILQTAVSEIRLDLKNHLEWSSLVIPRVFHFEKEKPKALEAVFDGLPAAFSQELLLVTFYRKNAQGRYDTVKEFVNESLESKRSILGRTAAELRSIHPLSFEDFTEGSSPQVLNRSFKMSSENRTIEVPIATFLIDGSKILDELSGMVIALDLIQDFIRHRLQGSDVANLFLISKKGTLLSHPSLSATIDYAKTKYPHPILPRLSLRQMPKEGFELETGKDTFLINLHESGIPNYYVVSQISYKEAFQSIRKLINKSILIAIGVFCLSLLFSLLLGQSITSKLEKIRDNVEQIGVGKIGIKLEIKSNDEIQDLGATVQWTSERLVSLMHEVVQKTKVEDKLIATEFFQTTFPQTQESDDRIEFKGFSLPVPLFSGDFWDVFSVQNKQTFIMGDALGKGTTAAMSSVAAKSCLAALRSQWKDCPPTPSQILDALNKIFLKMSEGKLLFSMTIAQLDLRTGELLAANAGSEFPLCLRSKTRLSRRTGSNVEPLVVSGERLGFAENTVYKNGSLQLESGDSLLFFTRGLTSARNLAGASWGERGLIKSFSQQINRPINTACESIISAIHHHVQGIEQAHDLTFLLATWKKREIVTLEEPSKQSAVRFPSQGESIASRSISNPDASQLSNLKAGLKEGSIHSDLERDLSSVPRKQEKAA